MSFLGIRYLRLSTVLLYFSSLRRITNEDLSLKSEEGIPEHEDQIRHMNSSKK